MLAYKRRYSILFKGKPWLLVPWLIEECIEMVVSFIPFIIQAAKNKEWLVGQYFWIFTILLKYSWLNLSGNYSWMKTLLSVALVVFWLVCCSMALGATSCTPWPPSTTCWGGWTRTAAWLSLLFHKVKINLYQVIYIKTSLRLAKIHT